MRERKIFLSMIILIWNTPLQALPHKNKTQTITNDFNDGLNKNEA